MCGLAGIVALRAGLAPPGRDALARMATALRHRGPDEYGVYRDAHAGLAHARLAIIDLATGQQPLADEDDATWIVFNGEIFNYLELRAELVALGHRFRTRGDTEVIAHAYRAWGDDAFRRMDGQWAVALWDSRSRRLVLSRDRVGICPLYYREWRGYLYFASEVRAIFAAEPDMPRAFDARGLDQTFTFWSIVPPRGVFQDIAELPPGHARVYADGAMRESAYDAPAYPRAEGAGGFPGDFGAAVAEVRRRLEQATALRMLRADVPVGAYLSGGLDSALVAALARRHAGDAFQTFSLRFADAEYDETEYQRLMARHLSSQHHEVTVSRRDIAEVFPRVVLHAERPILRAAPAPLFLLSGLARARGIKVVLTGEGADEMFAGYDIFREGKVRRFWARQPNSAWRPRLLERLYPYLARSPVAQQAMARQFFGRDLAAWRAPGFAHGPRWQTTAALKRLFAQDLRAELAGYDGVGELLADLPAEFPEWRPLAQDQYLEIRTLLTGYLLASQGDRMLMAHSVEGRFPFLDKDVVALANALPDRYKLHALDEKHVLKHAAAGLVPEAILTRKKQPFRAPDALSFVAEDAPDYIEAALSDAAVRAANVFDPAPVAQLWRKCRAGRGQFSNSDNMALLGVLSTQLLHQAMIATPPESTVDFAPRVDIDKVAL
jgi:asparagine synthase (glutamine-hydrolysing)